MFCTIVFPSLSQGFPPLPVRSVPALLQWFFANLPSYIGLSWSSISHRRDSVDMSAFYHHSLTCICRPEGVSLLIICNVLVKAVHHQKFSKTISTHFYHQDIGPRDTFFKYISFHFICPWVFPGKYYPYVSVFLSTYPIPLFARKIGFMKKSHTLTLLFIGGKLP